MNRFFRLVVAAALASGTIALSALPAAPDAATKVAARLTRQQREDKVIADATGLHGLLDAFWIRELASLYGITYDPPDGFEYYRGGSNEPCGLDFMPYPKNAFYCFTDGDEVVSFDLNWFQKYLKRHPGGATTYLILAHEWGHSVQDSWIESGGFDFWFPAYKKELNADCLAGVFLAAAIANGDVIEEFGDSEAIFGWLYESAQGSSWLDPAFHGTSEERQTAFAAGFIQGTVYCRTNY